MSAPTYGNTGETSEPVPEGAYEEMDDMAEFAAGAAHE